MADKSDRSTFLSPAPQPSSSVGRHGHVSTPDFISPTTRRGHALTSPATSAAVPVLGTQNDDEAEKRERRRSRLLEIQQRTLASPVTPTEKRTSQQPLGTLSNTQLAEHYKSCIKLSAENKITAKNAFDLHLIEYMATNINSKEMSNFQVASSTLDASAKIYAGRVDAIHSQTYKLLTGLGRPSDDKGKGKDDGEDAEIAEDGAEDPDNERRRKRKKRNKKFSRIQSNMKKINCKKFDLEFEVDPMFKKTSASFDEGGTGGLLLNRLHCLDDCSELILSSDSIVTSNDGNMPVDPESVRDTVKIRNREKYAGYERAIICPQFAEFDFSNWNRDSEKSHLSRMSRLSTGDGHTFDMNAEPEPIPEEDVCGAGDATQGLPGLDDFGADDFDDDPGDVPGDAQSLTEGDIQLGDGKEAQMVESAVRQIQHGDIVGSLMSILSSEPSDYSYFSSKFLRAWSGPKHWKIIQQKSKANNTTKKKKEKELFRINYDGDVDFDSLFKEPKRPKMLVKATLDRWSKSQKLLPEDYPYQVEMLFKLAIKPKVMVMVGQADTPGIDDNIENYDYDNPHDRENFCPGLDRDGVDDAGAADDDDDDNDMVFGFDMGCTGETQPIPDSAEGPPDLDGSILGPDGLIDQPHKVAKLDINYAKTAKKMDMKRLKTSMWSLLTKPKKDAEVQPVTEGASKENEPVASDEAAEHKFTEIVEVLPDMLSKNMASNLSVPIAFICLLHLANEKNLKISGFEDMSDLRICQG